MQILTRSIAQQVGRSVGDALCARICLQYRRTAPVSRCVRRYLRREREEGKRLQEIEYGNVLHWANIWDFHRLDYAYKTFGRIFICEDGRVAAWGDEEK